jgi:hypothetical protein
MHEAVKLKTAKRGGEKDGERKSRGWARRDHDRLEEMARWRVVGISLTGVSDCNDVCVCEDTRDPKADSHDPSRCKVCPVREGVAAVHVARCLPSTIMGRRMEEEEEEEEERQIGDCITRVQVRAR